MSTLLTREVATDIINALREGMVPSEGIEHIAVGLDDQIAAIESELAHVATRRGDYKAIRGEWGAGKTFLSKLALARAAAKGFATSHVTLSGQETRLFKLEEVYRAIVRGLVLPGVRRGALQQILERWIAQRARAVIETDGVAEDNPRHEEAVARAIHRSLDDIAADAPSFAIALGAYYKAKRDEDYALSRGLIGVLSGDPSIGAAIKRQAGLKGDLEGPMALAYLRALLEILHAAGMSGLVVVLDEADRLTHFRGPERTKAWETLHQLVEALRGNRFPGLYLVITGTRALFEGKKGIREYGALDQRLSVTFHDDEPDDLRQRQIRLRGFDRGRLVAVARRVREVFPASQPARVALKATDALIEAIVEKVSSGFGGQIAVMPRVFLREWVKILDLIDQSEKYEPEAKYRFDLKDQKDLSSDEQVAAGIAAAVEGDVPPQVF